MSNGDAPVPLSDDHHWDGSEAELVEDDDAKEYEEQNTGIKLSYKLKDKELQSCLTHGMFYKNRKKLLLKQVGIFCVLGLVFLCNYFFSNKMSALILFLVCVFCCLGLYGVYFYIKNKLKIFSTGTMINVEVYPDCLEINEDGKEWKINLDGSLQFEEFNNMFVIYLSETKVFIIPTRCIEPDFVADIQAMILAGTSPKNSD